MNWILVILFLKSNFMFAFCWIGTYKIICKSMQNTEEMCSSFLSLRNTAWKVDDYRPSPLAEMMSNELTITLVCQTI